jgi:hypothetical protein
VYGKLEEHNHEIHESHERMQGWLRGQHTKEPRT